MAVMFLAVLQNSKFISKLGCFYNILSVLMGNALEMLCVKKVTDFRKCHNHTLQTPDQPIAPSGRATEHLQ